MANWILSTGRKDLVEEQVWTKGDSTVKYQTLWRSGSWHVKTTDDNEPKFKADENGMVELGWADGENIESVEFEESWDGCGDDWEFSNDINEAEQERIQEGWEEDSFSFMEDDGWVEDDTYWYTHVDGLTFESATD